jgi:hypothetical protein
MVSVAEAAGLAPNATLRADGSAPPTHTFTGPAAFTATPLASISASIYGVRVNRTVVLAPGASFTRWKPLRANSGVWAPALGGCVR